MTSEPTTPTEPPTDQLGGLDLLNFSQPSSIFDTMGMTIDRLEPGKVKFAVRADARHLNPMGGVHGGFAATVLDSVTGCALHTMLDAGVRFATVDLAVKMVRPIPQDVTVRAHGWIKHMSRSLAVADGEIRDQEGQLLASGSATLFIKRP